ncbi:protein kinase [Inhella sp.]|uniref:serine/threonine protein kinase n=1 Tax=Inhella sp. TaxID=1921806 RepID=UPI0035B4AC70
MSAPDWTRLSALYDEGSALEPARREAWLSALHGHDAELVPRLRRMLGSAVEGEPLQQLRRAVAAALPAQETAQTASAQAGYRLGDWQLERPLGEGGMGQVWLARRADGLYEAQAAIKLLRADLGGEALQQRFARERRLLARLAHPGVAQLLDAGMDAQLGAYLVLEYVPGQTLSPHVRTNQLPLAERVRLLVAVAQAVQAAHAQLIVHRDLKPANVMVGEDGRPKLLDFGVATLLDPDTGPGASELTAWAGSRLTPAYAAPEQIGGEGAGTAADQYALGVMLFELASGFLPHGREGMTRAQLEHAVLHREAPRLAELLDLPERREGPGRPADAHQALGDLEAVCAKALRKHPAERYPSVGAFIEDLQRFLSSQPVSVRREDWQHRTRLWVRRNRALALAGTLLLAGLSSGLAVALHQRERAEEAARDAEAVSRTLTELLESASPDRHGGRPPTLLQLLDSQRAELSQRFENRPRVKDQVLDTLVASYLGMNRFDIAVPLATQRLEAARRHFGAQSEQAEDATLDLARLHTALANRNPVVDLLEPLLPRLRDRFGPDHTQTATARQQLAMALANLGRFADAEALLAEEWASVQRRFTPQEYSRPFHAQYEFVQRSEQGRLVEAERLIAGLAAQNHLASPQQQRFARVTERNLAQAQWRLLMDDAPRAIARAEELGGRIDALLGAGNDLHGTLRSALAEHLWQLDEPAAALKHLQRWQREVSALRVVQQGASNALAGLVRELSLLAARARAGQPVGLDELEAGLRQLDAEPLIAGQRRAEGLLHLAEAALHAHPPAASAPLLGRLQQALDRPGLVALPQWQARIERLRALRALRAGDPQARLTAARRASELLAGLPEPQGLASYAAHLQWAHALGPHGGALLTQALARADAARPAGLSRAMGGSLHPLDRLRQALGEGRFSTEWPLAY